MPDLETLGLAVSLLAVIVAFVSLYRTRSVDQLRKSLYGVQEQLVKLQLQRASRAKITVAMERVPATSDRMRDRNRMWDRFVVQNDGDEVATNVTFEALTGDGSPASLVGPGKPFPAEVIPPGQALSVGVAISHGTKLPFLCRWSWQDPDGTTQERESKVTPG